MEIDIKKIIENKKPDFFTKYPDFFARAILRFLEKISHARDIQYFFDHFGHLKNWEFIDAVFEYLDFRCLVSDEDMKKIPSKGKLICVANHKLGALDGLSLLKTIGMVRKDVKIVVSDVLNPLENMKDLLLFYDLFSSTLQKTNLEEIIHAIKEESTIIFFPSGEVAKMTAKGIREMPWQQGPISLARNYKVPVLPMYFNARNSLLYYIVTLFSPGFSTVLLPYEMFKKRSRSITLEIGEPISGELFKDRDIDLAAQTESLRNHVLGMGKACRP